MIGCLPRVLEVLRVVDDTEVPRILWVKCATSVECKNYSNSHVHGQGQLGNRSWATSTCLQTSVCAWLSGKNYLGQVKGLDMIELG